MKNLQFILLVVYSVPYLYPFSITQQNFPVYFYWLTPAHSLSQICYVCMHVFTCIRTYIYMQTYIRLYIKMSYIYTYSHTQRNNVYYISHSLHGIIPYQSLMTWKNSLGICWKVSLYNGCIQVFTVLYLSFNQPE